MLKQNLKPHHLISVMLQAVRDVEALVFCIVIIPMVFLCLVLWLNVVTYPLGAILFYSVYILLALGAAMVDYARKKRSC